MGYGGIGKDRIAVLRGGAGLAQADNQVLNQLGKVSGTLAVAERQVVEFLALCCPRQPVFDDKGSRALQYRAHPFLLSPGNRSASKYLFADEFREPLDFEWFYEDFVCFQKDSGHRALHVRVATHDQRKRIWL